jgi:HEAT repeat protein
MAKRLSVDEKLASIRRLRELPPSSEVTSELKKALRDKSNLIVAAAAAIAGNQKHIDLAADLEAAFERFLVDPLKTDKLCRAKIAIVEGLDKLEHERPDVLLRAARHVQFEPVWGGEEDTAAPLRAAAILALARMGYNSLLPLVVDSLADAQKEVRTAAAQALGCDGTLAASLLLRLKARLGDKEADVISECLLGLLNSSPQENLPFVQEFLDSSDAATREAAILALGRSRRPEAFDLLTTFWETHPIGFSEVVFMAMAMLRLPAATEFLLKIVTHESEKNAAAALSALLIHRYDPNLRARIAEAVEKSGSRTLQIRIERDADGGA